MKRKITLSLALLASILVLSCAQPTREFQAPSHIQDEAFSQTGTTELEVQWWQSFGDADLNELVAQALRQNYSLKATWDRFAQAEAQARIAGVELDPSLDLRAGTSLSRERSNGADKGSQRFNLGLFASYELDLWGRIRAGQSAEVAEAAATREDIDVAALSLSAELTRRWFEYQTTLSEQALLNAQRTTNAQTLTLLRAQFNNGVAAAADVLRQENLIERNAGELILVERDLALLRTQIALLLGQSASGQSQALATAGLPALPELPSTGLSLALLERRPDMRAAMLRVESADADLAKALADRYPRISISAGLETSGKASDLFDNWLVNLAANLVQPLLDGGERAAVVDRERARLSELINRYSQTALSAIQEVEAALIEETRIGEYRQSLDRQLARAGQILERVQESYLNQQSEYINVLSATSTLQTLQRDALRAQRDQLNARVALCRALAGGLPLERPELMDIDTPQPEEARE